MNLSVSFVSFMNFIRTRSAILLLLAFSFTAMGIAATDAAAADVPAQDERPLVVCSLFPQYDFVRQIAGDRVELKLLLPPGTESHAFDPRPSDIMTLNRADLFVFTGKQMEPWADRILAGLENKGLLVVDASSGITLKKNHDHEHEHETHGHGDHHHGYDPHIWLSPVLASRMVDNILTGLITKAPEHEAEFTANAETYKAKLARLDQEFQDIVRAGKRHTLAFGGHFAYRYFLEQYRLNWVTAYDTCSADGEPGVRRITQVIQYIKEHDIPCIYHEEFVEPRVARSIADQAGVELLEFSTAHNVTKEELESGVTYLDIMNRNRDNVARGLCQ